MTGQQPTDLRAPEHEARLAEGAAWWLRLREPNVAPGTISEWMQWCDECAENSEAFSSIQALWQKAGESPLRPVDKSRFRGDDYDGAVPVEEWLARAFQGQRESGVQGAPYAAVKENLPKLEESPEAGNVMPLASPQQQPSYVRPKGGSRFVRRAVPWAAAATVLIALILFAPRASDRLEFHRLASLFGNDTHVVTEIGANRELDLPDGSHVVLGGASELRVDYDDDRRAVRLERGEAYFQVKKDNDRPFVVVSATHSVTAVGTAFNVRADNGILRVTVADGIVEVRQPVEGAGALGSTEPIGEQPSDRQESGPIVKPGGASGASVRLRAGQQVTVQAAATSRDLQSVAPVYTSVVTSVDPQLAGAWRTGTLKFMEEPLESVIAAVNRYSHKQIVLDAEGTHLRYTGTVMSERIEEWLAALPNSFAVDVELDEDDPDRVVLKARP